MADRRSQAGYWMQRAKDAEAALRELRSALSTFLADGWGVELDDERLGYICAQIDRHELAAIRAALAASPSSGETE